MRYPVFFLTLLLIFFAGCKDDNPVGPDTTKIRGNWILIKSIMQLTSGGVTTTDSLVCDLTDTCGYMLLTIDANTITAYDNNSDETYNSNAMSYTASGNKLVLDSGEVYWSFVNNYLVVESRFSLGNIYAVEKMYLSEYTGNIPPGNWLSPIPNDSYEPDSTHTLATDITANGTEQSHMLLEGDRDWLAFPATAGTSYLIRTSGFTDTYLELYDTTGLVLLDEDDDNDDEVGNYMGLNAVLLWPCVISGTYYFNVSAYSEDEFGRYGISVSIYSSRENIRGGTQNQANKEKYRPFLWKD